MAQSRSNAMEKFMGKHLIIALHGFLGQPMDWNTWQTIHRPPSSHFWALNLWSEDGLTPHYSMDEWTQNFCSQVERKKQEGFIIDLWGYSMGGRLALSALSERPDLFRKAQILSANPGLESNSERALREKNDQVWAQRFNEEDWSSLMKAWNEQPVFQVTANKHSVSDSNVDCTVDCIVDCTVDNSVNRQENFYKREILSLALVNWSLARQKNFWQTLSALPLPIEWHAGDEDSKYKEIATRASASNTQFQLKIHPHRGHRLL